MAKSAPLTEEERAQRRAADREFARQAVEALRTSDGWQRWLSTRAVFHRYSLANQLLVAMQRPTAVRVAGFRKWLQLGYCVCKGEKAIRIWAPVPPSAKKIQAWKDAGANPNERPRTHFKLTGVFADDQVQELPPPAEPQPISCPIRELEGDDLAGCLPALARLGNEIGSALTFEPISGGASGYYVPATKQIVIDSKMTINQQVSVACHELGHALVRSDHQDEDPQLDYASEELVVESVAFTVIRSLRIDASLASIPYLAAWAESSDLSVIEKTAELIDRLAKRLEDALFSPEPGSYHARDDTDDQDGVAATPTNSSARGHRNART
jgi:antirestriction protein ArdC